MSDLERIIKPIVEGQLRSYLNDHPEIADAYIGKRRPGISKRDALVSSMAKRISNDLLCEQTRSRLHVAVWNSGTGLRQHRAWHRGLRQMLRRIRMEVASVLVHARAGRSFWPARDATPEAE